MSAATTALINGEPAESIPLADRAFQYSDGVFETVRAVDGRLTLWSAHQARLSKGCKKLCIPLDVDKIEHEALHLLELGGGDGVIKLIVSRGSGGRGYAPPDEASARRIVQYFPLPANPWLDAGRRAHITLCRHPLSVNPSLAGLKLLGRLDQVLASAELSGEYDEGIMCTTTGAVIEGTRSNLFIERDGKLHTPALNEAGIAGVMRDYLLAEFSRTDVSVKEGPMTLAELQSATALFLCNSVFGVWPVADLVAPEQTIQYKDGHFTAQAVAYAEHAFKG